MSRLHSYRYPACADSDNAPELVLLHGWGLSGIIWQEWLPLLQPHCQVTVIDLPGFGGSEPFEQASLDSVVDAIVAIAPPAAVYLGYSLGGMLAVNIAHRYPERVQAVITFASNQCFVASEQWPYAMPAATYQSFYKTVQHNADKALKRFCGLQASGASNEKALLKVLRDKLEPASSQNLVDSLDLLAAIDNSRLIGKVSPPAYYLFAECDQLVPLAAAKQLQQQWPGQVDIIASAPHSFFISDPQASWQRVKQFLQQQSLLPLENSGQNSSKARLLDKRQVARSFSRAAASYDSVAELQRQVGERLLQRLPDTPAAVVLDLGCGTGFFTSALQQHYPQSTLVGLDLAEGMVAYAASHQQNDHWLCGDAEALPLADNSVDVVFSSLAIQWCENNQALFAEIYRVLKPSGYFVFATLGPDTLHELRTAWRAVDDYVHVNRFDEQSQLSSAATEAGFMLDAGGSAWSEQMITLEYDKLKTLTRELKSLGAHNVNSGRPAGLTGRRRLQQLMTAYEQQRNDNARLPASYQAWYAVMQKPQQVPKQAAGK